MLTPVHRHSPPSHSHSPHHSHHSPPSHSPHSHHSHHSHSKSPHSPHSHSPHSELTPVHRAIHADPAADAISPPVPLLLSQYNVKILLSLLLFLFPPVLAI